MSTGTATVYECYPCNVCGLSLPIRLPRPGEVASSWECRYCSSRFFATLIDTYPPEILTNVRPSPDIHPRIAVGGAVLAQLYKREGRGGRDFEGRRWARVASEMSLTIIMHNEEVATQSLDLSAGGVGFVSTRQANIGEIITARFDAIPGKPSAICTVRNCADLGEGVYRIGAEFRDQMSAQPVVNQG
ncbi:MAG TPA: PilZ domain-containing protein [Phycisphaerae bacterium]|nr:PilZ domain-containing protein [Phycisphaerae bacterium]